MTDATVEASNLSKSFGDKQVLQEMSFGVSPGDVIGVLGKNGAGKTTLLELMLGFTPPTGGAVRIFGHESYSLPGSVKARVGFVPQQDELLDQLTVADQLRVIASFYPRWDSALITRLCGEWGVNMNARIKSMSVGERQKLSILLAFGHKPELLILDEPVASLDPIARRQFLEQLLTISADGQRSIVFSSHIVSDIERLANRIWILKDGKLDWQGDLDSLKESIVRLHIRGVGPELAPFKIPGVLNLRRDGAFATAVVRDWTPEAQEALGKERVGADRSRDARARGNLRGAASMKAVARLVWSYFTGTPVLRAFTIGGLILMAIDFYILATQPQSGEKLWLAMLGIIVFFVGSSLMPVMFGRLARSHAAGVLPGGRVKLLVERVRHHPCWLRFQPALLAPAGFVSGNISASGIHERSAGA